MALIPASTTATREYFSPQDLTSTATDKKLESENQLILQSQSHQQILTPSFLRKRKCDIFQLQHSNLLKICRPRCPPEWESPLSSHEKALDGGERELKRADFKLSMLEYPVLTQESQTKISLHETEIVLKQHKDLHTVKEMQQTWESKMEERSNETATNVCKQTPSCKPCTGSKCSVESATNWPESLHKGVNTSELQTQSNTGCQVVALTSDARVKDFGKLNLEERMQMLEKAVQSEVLVLTMVYRDGTTQLDREQVSGALQHGVLAGYKL